MTQVQSDLSSLTSTVGNLQTAITAIQTSVDALPEPNDYSTELADLASGLTDAQTTIDALNAALANVATTADLGTISSTLAEVQADVRELLESNAVINQNITTLHYYMLKL